MDQTPFRELILTGKELLDPVQDFPRLAARQMIKNLIIFKICNSEILRTFFILYQDELVSAREKIVQSAYEGNVTTYTAASEWPKVWSEERSYDAEGDCTETLGARFLNKFLLSDISTDTRNVT